jgi:hypothetical protein
MNNDFFLGHAAIYPATFTEKSIPYLDGIRLIRERDSTGAGLYTIACTASEHRAVCQFLARRRAKAGNATSRKRERRAMRRAGKGVSHSQDQ